MYRQSIHEGMNRQSGSFSTKYGDSASEVLSKILSEHNGLHNLLHGSYIGLCIVDSSLFSLPTSFTHDLHKTTIT